MFTYATLCLSTASCHKGHILIAILCNDFLYEIRKFAHLEQGHRWVYEVYTMKFPLLTEDTMAMCIVMAYSNAHNA